MRLSRLVPALACGTFVLAAATTSAVADIRILGSPGGEVGGYFAAPNEGVAKVLGVVAMTAGLSLIGQAAIG